MVTVIPMIVDPLGTILKRLEKKNGSTGNQKKN